MAATASTPQPAILKRQFNLVVSHGWLPFVYEGAELHHLTPEIVLAVMSRETNCDPVYLTKPGDNGNGFGLMQIDKRSFPGWCNSGKWKDARQSIVTGCYVLELKRSEVVKNVGRACKARSSKDGQVYQFTGKAIAEPDLTRVMISDYNCGAWGYYNYSVHSIAAVDRFTTKHDYSEDVLARADVFRALLAASPDASLALAQTQMNRQTDAAPAVVVAAPASAVPLLVMPSLPPVVFTADELALLVPNPGDFPSPAIVTTAAGAPVTSNADHVQQIGAGVAVTSAGGALAFAYFQKSMHALYVGGTTLLVLSLVLAVLYPQHAKRFGKYCYANRETIMKWLKKIGRVLLRAAPAITAVAIEKEVPTAENIRDIVDAIHNDPTRDNKEATEAIASVLDKILAPQPKQ